MSNKKVLLDKEVSEKSGISAATLSKWKYAKEGSWRYALYLTLKENHSVRAKLFSNLSAKREGEEQERYLALMEKRSRNMQA